MNPRIGWFSGPACLAAVVGMLVFSPPAAAQQQGTVQGTVTDARSGAPLGSAQISIVGTQRGTLAGADGSYRIPNVTAGELQVRATFLGFATSTQTVTLQAGQTVTANFQLSPTALALDELIVTGTAGRQERRAQAASVASLDAASLTEVAPVTTVANLLQARTAGVNITTASGTAGSTQRIRLRGAASINLSNEPLVIIDGVLMDSRQNQLFGVGGQAASRLNDINPNDIESIEIVKGPAASTLYGSDASAGVIQIRTKRGRAGAGFTQNVSYEFGSSETVWDGYENFGACSQAAVNNPNSLCAGRQVGDVISDNPLVRENVWQRGLAHNFAWSGRGGGENFGYYLSFSSSQEEGILPGNEFNRYNARMNFDFTPRDDLRFDASMGLGRTDNLMPQNDNNIYGYLGGALLGTPLSVGVDARDGWFGSNRQVEAIRSIENETMAVRVTPIVTVNYNPLPWFTHRASVGADITRSEALSFFPKNDVGWYGTATLNSGQIAQRRDNRDQVTFDYLGSIRRPIGDDFVADLAFGGQAVATRRDIAGSVGQGLTTNAARSVNAAAQTTGEQQYAEGRYGGLLTQLDLAYRDRVYLQLGGRLDRSSAFGRDVDTFLSPKVGVSYVISEEDFFPVGLQSVFSTLRLRTVWGSTGRSPASDAALTTFDPAPFAVTPTQVGAGVIPLNPGNPDLKAERGEEWELGFDAGLFNERIGLEVTYYDKTSKDLLLRRPLAPSLGFAENPFVNIGEVANTGWEVGVSARVLEVPGFAWDARLNYSTNVNKVVDLGEVEPFGAEIRVVPDFPVNGRWTHSIRQLDVANNVAIVSDTVEFVGRQDPGNEGNFSSTFTIFRNFRVYAQVDWMRDFVNYNNTDQFRERQFGTGERWVRRNDESFLPAEERLRRFGPFRTEDGRTLSASAVNAAYFQDAGHMKFRELTVSYTLPSNVAEAFRARGATITAGARNLKTWTDYEGPDPEVNGLALQNFNRWDFLTLPQPRRYIARVNLTF
jgi:TonB-dependent starch-binding outer membrane protein SusC